MLPTPAVFCLPEADVSLLVTALSTLGAPPAGASPASSSAAAPCALAAASTVEDDPPIALNVTSPPAPVVTLRSVVAKTWSSTIAKAKEAPTAAFAPAASALAVVVVAALCAAETETEPVVVSGAAPVPNRAVVVLFTSESATTGVNEKPPEDPASAVVVMTWVASADSVNALAPVTVAPSPTSARDRVAMMFNPTDAPRPSVEPVAPPSAGLTVTEDVVLLSVFASTSPLPPAVIFTATPAPIVAVVRVSTRFKANDPANPKADAPAPDVDVVVNELPTLADNGLSDKADKWMLLAETAVATTASFLTLATLIPIATPTPFAELTAVPSAVTAVWFSELLATSKSPNIVAEIVVLYEDFVVDVRSEIAKAPATERLPSLVDASSPYLAPDKNDDACDPAEGSVAPPAPAIAVTVTSVAVDATRFKLAAVTFALPANSAVVTALITLTPTLAPNAAAAGVAFATEMILFVAVTSIALVATTLAVPKMRASAVLLMVETATAPSPALFAGAKDSVGMLDVTVELAVSETLSAVISLVPATKTLAVEFVTTIPIGNGIVDRSPFAVAVAETLKAPSATISPLVIVTFAVAVGAATKSAKLSTVDVAVKVISLPCKIGAAPVPSPIIISAVPPLVWVAVSVTSPVVPALTVDPLANVIFGALIKILPAVAMPYVELSTPPEAIVIELSATKLIFAPPVILTSDASIRKSNGSNSNVPARPQSEPRS